MGTTGRADYTPHRSSLCPPSPRRILNAQIIKGPERSSSGPRAWHRNLPSNRKDRRLWKNQSRQWNGKVRLSDCGGPGRNQPLLSPKSVRGDQCCRVGGSKEVGRPRLKGCTQEGLWCLKYVRLSCSGVPGSDPQGLYCSIEI